VISRKGCSKLADLASLLFDHRAPAVPGKRADSIDIVRDELGDSYLCSRHYLHSRAALPQDQVF
jgi:hypothetical protein